MGPDPRRALGPAAIPAASTGRTRDRTRPMLQKRQKVLARAPSTRDPCRTSLEVRTGNGGREAYIAKARDIRRWRYCVIPFAPASRLSQAEAAGPSSLLRNGQDHAATSAQLRGLCQPARPNPKHRVVRVSYYFGDVCNGLSAHLALGDFIRPIAAGTVFSV